MALPSLVVRLGLDAAEFFSGLTKAEAASKAFAGNISQLDKANKDALASANALGRSLGLAFAGAITAAGGAVVAVDQLIKSVAKFKDLEEKIGGNAEGFASLAVAAAVGSTSMEEVARISVQLTKNLDNVKGTAKGTAAGLAALQIPLKEFKALDPAGQMERLGKALNKFADGAGKTAALEAIVRGGAQLLPFLKELEAQGGRQVVLTQQQIELADKYADTQARLGAQIKQQLQKAAIEAAPAMLALTQTVHDLITGVTGLAGASTDLARNRGIHDFAVDAGKALASLATLAQSTKGILEILLDTSKAFGSAAIAVAKQDFGEAAALAEASLKRSSATIKGQVTPSQLFEKNLQQNAIALLREQENAYRAGPGSKKPLVRPIADFSGGAKTAKTAIDDPTNRILAGQIKALEANVARERDILNARQGFLRDNFSEGYISVANYYAQVQQARDEALRNTLAAYDKEIAATKDVQAKRKRETDRQGDQNQIDSITEKQVNLIRDAEAQEQALSRERTRATEQYGIQLSELNAKMLELSGNTAAASEIRFDNANRAFNNLLKASGNTAGLAQQESLKRAEKNQSALNDKTREFHNILDRVGIEQERINIAQQSGAIGELAALAKTSVLNKSRIADLQRIADAYTALAAQAATPIIREENLIKAEQLRLAIERLGAQTDLVADKFNKVFGDAFSNSLSSFIDGTKSAKDAFKDFTKSVTAQINQIASQNIAEKLFGKDGPASGIGDLFSGLFGGGKAATKGADPAAAAASALAATTSTSTTAIASLGSATSATALALQPLDAGLGSLTLAAQSASTALLAIGKGGGLPNVATPVDTSAADASLASLSKATSSAADGLTNVGVATSATDQALSAFGVGFSGLTKSVAPLITGLGGLGSSANLVTTALRSSSRDLLTDFSNAIKVDPAALSGLSAAATTTTSTLAALSGASAATDLAMAPLTTGFAGLSTSVDSVANALLSTGRSAASLFAGFQLPDIAIPDIAIDTSAFAGLNVAAQNTTSALATVANASAATELSMAPLRAGFASLNTSAGTVAQALLATGQKAGTFADFLSKTASTPEISVDTTSLLGLDRAAASTTSALAAVASSSAATDLAMTPLQSGFASLSTSATDFASSLVASSKDVLAGLSSLPTAAPSIVVPDAGLLAFNTALTSTTAMLTTSSVSIEAAMLALSGGATSAGTSMTTMAASTVLADLAMTPLSSTLLSLTISAEAASAALLAVAGSKGAGAMGDLFSEFASSALGGLAQGGGFARGGNPPIGRASWVGERGPELFVPKIAGTIVPNKDIRTGGDTVSNVFHINVPPGTTSQSASQMALAVGREVSRTMRRKN